MFEQVQRQEQRTIIAARSEAAAEFVAVTLQAHGVPAHTRAYFHAYPSVDWVEGFSVQVQLEDEARARQLLRDLAHGRDDLAEVEDPASGDPA